MDRRRVALGVALLFALAGCTGSGVPADTELTVTPAPVPTDASPAPDYRLAPGLAEEGVVAPLTLASAHAERLRSTVYRVRIAERVERSNGPVRWRVLEGTFANRTSYSMRVREGVGNRTILASWFYADGERLYERLTIENETRYYVPRSGLSAGADYPQDRLGQPAQREPLYVALSGARPTSNGTVSIDGTEHYRLSESSRVNDDFLAAYEYVSALTNYEFDAVVSPTGLVRAYRISYEATVRGERRRVVRTARWTDIGTARVTPPAWYATARNRTGA